MVWVIILCVWVSSCDVEESEKNGDHQRITRIVESQAAQPVDEYTVFRAPTGPMPIGSVIPEWEPAAGLALALPYDDAVSEEKILGYYMDIVQNAIRCVDVILLVDERELPSFKQILLQLRERNLEGHLRDDAERRIFLVPARFNSKWIRDYGPVFARNTNGALCVLDAEYRDVREEPEVTGLPDLYAINPTLQMRLNDLFGDLFDSGADYGDRHEDDSAPVYLTTFLDQQFGWDIQIARVPLQLWGGDVFFDGRGNLFLSSETLRMNGGRREDVELLLRHYYGMKTLTCLEPLPGETIKHLDMIFKPAGPQALLAADYPRDAGDSDIYMQYLHEETRRILENNAARLRQAFPACRLERVPMPPLERTSILPGLAMELTGKIFSSKKYPLPGTLSSDPERWTFERFVYFLHTIDCLYNHSDSEQFKTLSPILGIEDSDHFNGGDEVALNTLAAKLTGDDPALLEWLADPFRGPPEEGKTRTSVEEGLKKLLDAYGYQDMIENPQSYTYVYRTYLNMTYIDGPSGQMLLVPQYAGCETYEPAVRKIYQDLYPQAEIVFIASDAIIEQYGTIHCVTLTVPDLARIRSRREQ